MQSEQNRTQPTFPASTVVISEICTNCCVESLHAKLRTDTGALASRRNNYRVVSPQTLYQSQSTRCSETCKREK